ncbi:gliding motility-associated C-terminal domain-containing protein [Algoriphagus sp. AK58]|uniref:T9SS type B sorting domain-containing protein n=1 Tax=Algoriphagus sp. AK58 TaxID=1406877 RepID=UPI00164F650F
MGSYSGGGNPATDLYSWKVFGPSNELLFSRGPGAFPNITVTYIQNGNHTIELEVTRGGLSIGKFTKPVQVVSAPKITLENEYLICSSQSLTLTAIDPTSSNFSSYQFEWEDQTGAIVSNSNTLTINQDGEYTVRFFLTNSSGEKACEHEIKTVATNISSFSIQGSASTVCVGGELSFETVPSLSGEWFVQKTGSPSKKSLGKGNSIQINPAEDLTDFGDYELSFLLENTENPSCTPEEKVIFNYNPQPIFVFESSEGASDCLAEDGKLTIKAQTDLDFINLEDTGISIGPFSAGDLIEIPNLKSGTYNLIGFLGSCSNSIGSVVPLNNRPPSLDFEVSDITGESCTDNGKNPGSFKVTLKSVPTTDVFYRIINEKGGVAKNEALPNSAEFIVEIGGGKYFFEIYSESEDCILPWKEELEIPGKELTAFEIPEEINICQSFQFTPNTKQALEFKLVKPDGTSEIKKAGEEFTIDQAGEYQLTGFIPNQNDICPTQKSFKVNLIDPVDFEIELTSEDCIIGNRSYKANIFSRDPSEVLFYWRNEREEIIGTGQTLFLPPTAFGEYSLEVQPANSEACPIAPKKFLAKKPVLSVDVTLEATKLCEYGPRAIIDLSTTFPEEVTDIEWRRYDELGNIEDLPQFKNLKQVIVEEEGSYEAAVFSRIPSIGKDCELGRGSIKMDLILEKVDFQIPGDLSICDPYELVPQSPKPLTFKLTYPDGNEVTKNWNEPFTLDQDGSYTLLGFDTDPKGPECPEQKTFVVTINPPVQFSAELVSLACDGTYEYQAQVTNYSPSEVDFFWFDPSGTLVSTSSTLFTSTYGNFQLEVQPSGSIPCKNQNLTFTVPIPVLQVDTQIEANPLCPDQPNASLRVAADFEPVQTIQWWFTDLSNNTRQLLNETDKKEILAFEEGTYEVRLFNPFNCLVGQDQTLVIRSTDQVRPQLEETYLICPRYEIAPTLDPGRFASYEWYFEGNLVSSNPTFKPLQTGNYELIVFSDEGCAYQTTFTTQEECELRLRFPDAIQPGNSGKQFLIYTNYLVDELEIWIFNKWGNLIFHCKNLDLIDQESTCLWDGFYNGQKVPPGSYAFRINYKNLEKNIKKEQLGTVLVIE